MANKNPCPKYGSCSAPICPIDEHWSKRVYVDGDPTCPYLREWVKPGIREHLLGAIDGEMASALVETCPKIMGVYGPHRKRLLRSAKTPTQMFRGGVNG